MPKLLLVDDDVGLCEILQGFLKKNNVDSDFVNSAKDALNSILSEPLRYELLVLDITMPGESGLELLDKIKKRSLNIPVIMLTGLLDVQDKLSALNLGADDYICKPCDPRELLARVKAVLRRADGEMQRLEAQKLLRLGDIELNSNARTVHIGDNAVALTAVEFQLLNLLLVNAGKTVLLQSLSIDVLGRPHAPDDRSLNKHASNLRQKLGTHPNGVERIRTVRGKGFIYTFPSIK